MFGFRKTKRKYSLQERRKYYKKQLKSKKLKNSFEKQYAEGYLAGSSQGNYWLFATSKSEKFKSGYLKGCEHRSRAFQKFKF